VTPEVTRCATGSASPGIKVLQFRLPTPDPQAPTFLPHSYGATRPPISGTHDNDTTVGWFHDPDRPSALRSNASKSARGRSYLAVKDSGRETSTGTLNRGVWSSWPNIALAPMQDFLGLGSSAG